MGNRHVSSSSPALPSSSSASAAVAAAAESAEAVPIKIQRKCNCNNCDITCIQSLKAFQLMNECITLMNACSRIMQLFSQGYISQTDISRQDDGSKHISTDNLRNSFTHSLYLQHPEQLLPPETFYFARYRSCISLLPTSYRLYGFYVSDNTGMVFLKVFANPATEVIQLRGWYINLNTNSVKSFRVSYHLPFRYLDTCSVYLRSGSLWVVYNFSSITTAVTLTFLNEDTVRTLSEQITNIYGWNPNGKENVMKDEIKHDIWHVTVNEDRTRIIKLDVSLYNCLIPLTNEVRECAIDFRKKIASEYILLHSAYYHGRYKQEYYETVSSEETHIDALRINERTILILDLINCEVIQDIDLNEYFDISCEIAFQFSRSGRSLYVLGKINGNPTQKLWKRFLIQLNQSLKVMTLRKVRELFSAEDLQHSNLPWILISEITFGAINLKKHN